MRVHRIVLIASLAIVTACSLGALDGFSGGGPPSAGGGADAGDAEAATEAAAEGDAGPFEDSSVDAPPNAYAQTVMADSPLAYYRFEETDGASILVDELNAYPGTYPLKPKFGVPGIGGSRAVELPTGARAHARVPTKTFNFTGTTSMAIEIWWKAATFTNYEWLLTSETTTGPRRGWSLLLTDRNEVRLEHYESTDAAINQLTTYLTSDNGPSLAIGVWHHVVVQRGGGSLALFVDGALSYNGNNAPFVDGEELAIGCSADDLTIGYCLEGGAIDEVAFYDHPLGAARIKVHYDMGKP